MYKGVSMTLAECIEQYGADQKTVTVRSRLLRGWSLERALHP